MATKLQIRRGTASNWASVNPVLADGQQGYETDTGKLKIGNGTTAWNSLSYFSATDTSYKGWYANEAALISAYPSGSNGWYAIIGDTDTVWTWDSDTAAWVNTGVTSTTTAEEIHFAGTKSIPVDADEFGYVDTEDSNVLKKLTWANIKSVLNTYFGGIYSTVTTFLGLTDTPSSYTGLGGSYPRVNSGAAALEFQKNNFNASDAPTVNNDIDEGYSIGSRWIDLTNDKEYVCLDTTDGAAVWIETTGSDGGGGHELLENDVALTQRAGLNVITNGGYTVLVDDAGNNETEFYLKFLASYDLDVTGLSDGDLFQYNSTSTKVEPVATETDDKIIYSIEANLSADGQLSTILPAGYKIHTIIIQETAGNAVTGGIDIGSAASGNDIVSAETVSASSVNDATVALPFFSLVNDTDLYISAVTAWNSAVVTVRMTFIKI